MKNFQLINYVLHLLSSLWIKMTARQQQKQRQYAYLKSKTEHWKILTSERPLLPEDDDPEAVDVSIGPGQTTVTLIPF